MSSFSTQQAQGEVAELRFRGEPAGPASAIGDVTPQKMNAVLLEYLATRRKSA